MAKQFSKTGIETGLDIEAHHVTQSVDAFTGIDEYDITLSGSFVVSGSSNRTTIIDNQYKVEGSDFTITGSNDIVLDADGSQIYMKDGGADRFTFNLGTSPELDVIGNFELNVASNFTVDAGNDIILDADGSNIIFRDNGTLRYNFLLDATPTLSVTGGDFTIDSSDDIILDADGGNIAFKDDGTLRYNFSLDANPTLSVTGSIFTITGSGIIHISTDNVISSSADLHLYNVATSANSQIRYYENGDTRLGIRFTSVGNEITSEKGITTIAQTGSVTLKPGIDDKFVRFDGASTGFITSYNAFEFYVGDSNTDPKFIKSYGDLTISASGTDRRITLDASGDITLDADGGDIYMKDGGTTIHEFDLVNRDIKLGSVAGNQTISIYGTTPTSTTIAGNSIVLQGGQGGTLSGNGGGVSILGGDAANGGGNGGDVVITSGNQAGTPLVFQKGDVFIGVSGNNNMMIASASNDIYFNSNKIYFNSELESTPGNGNYQFGFTTSSIYYPNVINFETYDNGGNIRISSSAPSYAANDSASINLINYGDYGVLEQLYGTQNFYIVNKTGSGGFDYGKINFGGENIADRFIMYMKDRIDIESAAGGGLDIAGNLRVGGTPYKAGGGSWSATSDSRLKENIITASIDTCYDGVKNLSLKYFRWKEEVSENPQYDEHQLGWIAQDVESIFPHAVRESDFLTWSTYTGSEAITGSEFNTILYPGGRYQDPLAGSELIENRKILDADQITKMMFGAIQKLQQKVEALEAQISGSN